MDIKTILSVAIVFLQTAGFFGALDDLADRMFSSVTAERLQECYQKVAPYIASPDRYPSLEILPGNDVIGGIRFRDRSVHSVFCRGQQVGCIVVYKNGACFNGNIALAIVKHNGSIYCSGQSQLYEHFDIRLHPRTNGISATNSNEQTRIISCSFYWDDQVRLCIRINAIDKPGIDHLLLPLPADPMPQSDEAFLFPNPTDAVDTTGPAPSYGPQAPHGPRPGPY